MSICIHCGQEHIASLRICPKTGKPLGSSGQASQQTLFGVAPSPLPPLPAPNRKPAPAPAPPPMPAAGPRPALAKTMVGVAPPPISPRPPMPPALPAARLPTAQEARDNPDLVISLDETPPAAYPIEPLPRPAPSAELPKARANLSPPSEAESPGSPGEPSPMPNQIPPGDAPVDLPPVGAGNRFVLPEPEAETARRTSPEGNRTVRDARMVLGMLGWAVGNYLGHPKQLFLLAAFLILPASILNSCLLAGTVPIGPTALAGTTVDFSARKAELAARIQRSQARGQEDKQAAAELAALTTMETAPAPAAQAEDSDDWLRARLASLIQGFLLFGLALPVALAALALATIDQQGGVALPGFADVWPVLVARAELFLVSLLPEALLVALGHALFVIPGLVLSVLFIFLPHVVLFEKRRGRAALARSVELVKTDVRRAVLAFLVFGLVGFLAAVLAQLLFPPSGSRAVAFVHFLLADLLAALAFPVPAMVLARLYLDIRARTGSVAERLSRAARS